MQARFEIPCRSIRIGSLRTIVPQTSKFLRFSTKGFRFFIEIEKDGKNENLKITIPLANVDYLEGYVGRGCPVIWIKTDTIIARKIRELCGMKPQAYRVPYFDPASPELTDQRISIIPHDDPIASDQLAKLRSLIHYVAHTRRIRSKEFFREQERSRCGEQLVACTRYITELRKVKMIKTEKNDDAYSVVVVKQEKSEEKDNDTIVISSDEDERVTMKGATPATTAGTRNRQPRVEKNPEPEFPLTEKARNDNMLKSTEDCQDNQDKSDITMSLQENPNADNSSVDIGPKTTTKRTMHVNPAFSPKKAKISDKASGGLDDVIQKSISAENKVNTDNVVNTISGDKKSKADKILDDELDVRSLRGTASLSTSMQTLHQDAESMLSVTPLCTCIVRSQYSINFASYKITCMAVDNVNGKLIGCMNIVSETHMMRPSKNLPAHGLCSYHYIRMVAHECCPCCGTFCTGGTFLVCSNVKEFQHRFHKDCLILTRHTLDCPHCGCPMSDIQEITMEPRDEFYRKYEKDGREVVEKSPDKRKQPSYHDCVVRIPGVTKPVPENLLLKDEVSFVPDKETLDLLLSSLDEELSKKLKFHPKNLFTHVKQGELVKTAQLLIFTGGNPDFRNPANMKTALHEAALKGNLPMVHLLVTLGANVNSVDEDGKNAIIYADEQNHLDLVKYLIASGVVLTTGDSDGMTPLHHASREGRLKSCLILLKYERKAIDCRDDGGWTPLVWAAEHRRAETARCLTYFDTTMNSVDNEGNVCLQWAAFSGNTEILMMCLRKNSNLDHQNTLGDTALHIAAREDHKDCVVLLLAWGANPLVKNKEGNLPSQCAKEPSMCQVILLMNVATRSAITNHKGFEPLDRERLLCADISRGKEKIPISCVNAVDEAPCPVNPPHEFLYICKNLYKYTNVNAVVSNTKSCKCLNDCSSFSCGCGPCWYDAFGRLLPSFDFNDPPQLYECNQFCKCPKGCRNRVIHKGGVRFRLQVFRTPKIGWGVRATEVIPRGSFVCEFIGEVISSSDAREDDFYLFDLSDKPDGAFCIDGRSYGNVSRFINHHCEPNLVPIRFFHSHQDVNFPRIAFFANRDIKPEEELNFDYGAGFWDENCKYFTCECEAPICKYSEKVYKKRNKIKVIDGDDSTNSQV